jgi:hypothetical protein
MVVHGELAPPARVERRAVEAWTQPVIRSEVVQEPMAAPAGHQRRISRASWPRWDDIADEVVTLLAASSHANYFEAFLQEISPFSRPDDPYECAEILDKFGVPHDEVMSFLENLGLVLKARSTVGR